MKTLTQIRDKIKKLKTRLDGRPVRENFGDSEQVELQAYIGDIWDYPYSDRLLIASYTKQFFEWCYNYTGSSVIVF